MVHKLQRQKAYEEIKRAIVTLRFEMGKNINEQELCQEFNLGRTPIREALQLLASEGLVEIFPRKGVYVGYVSLEDFQKIFQTRIMVETFCMSEATQKISTAEIRRLKQIIQDSEPLVDKRDIEGLLRVDRDIHMGIVRSLDNKYIEQVASQVYDLVTRMWFLSFQTKTEQDLMSSLKLHNKLLDALSTRDVSQAQDANQEHLDQFVNQIYEYLMPRSSDTGKFGKYYRQDLNIK